MGFLCEHEESSDQQVREPCTLSCTQHCRVPNKHASVHVKSWAWREDRKAGSEEAEGEGEEEKKGREGTRGDGGKEGGRLNTIREPCLG